MLYLYYARLQSANAADGSVAVRALLDKALARTSIIAKASTQKTPTGRPFLPHAPFLDISFSHTVSLAVCALLDKREIKSKVAVIPDKTPSTWQIGVDAEPLSSPTVRDPLAFSRRFFGEHEQAFVNDAPDAARAMLKVFTAKEAYAKQCGDGLAKHLSKTDTMAPGFCESRGVCFKRMTLADHTVTLCLPASLFDIDVTCVEIEL